MHIKDKGLMNMAKIVEYSNSKGKLYRFRVYAGIDETTGKKKYIKRSGFKTKAQAKKELVKLEYELANGDYFQPVEMQTFRDVYNLWIEQYRLTVKESTLNITLKLFSCHILPLLGSYRVDKLNLAICQRAVNQWYKARPASFKRLITYSSLVLEYARKLGLTDKDPFKDVTRPKEIKSDRRNFFELDQLKQFLTLAEKKSLKHFTLFRLLAYSGMRIGELLALTWDDVDFSDNAISINKTQARGINDCFKVQTPKTRSSIRKLDMDLETMQILRRWKVQQASYLLKLGINAMSKDQLCFSSLQNELLSPAIVSRWLSVISKDTDLPKITLHGFRHTHATLLLSAGASVKEVQTRLGHSKVQTTLDIYTHLTRQDQKDTIQKFVRLMG